jgi:hypothetical protein
MGANAQTAVPVFTAGQVLTAAQVTQINTGIPVFATTTTRDAAFGGAGEKTLAQGQTCYIESSSSYQTYNGSSWVTFGTSSGLTLVASQTIGSAVSSVTVSGAFSSLYENYKITVSGGVASTFNALYLTLGATATGYYSGGVDLTYAGATSAIGQANTAFWNFGGGTVNALSGQAEILQPFAAKTTTYFSDHAFNAVGANGSLSRGFLNNTTSYTAFTLTTSSGTITGGTIRVYGYANS